MSVGNPVNATMAAFLADRMSDGGVGFVGVGSSGRSYELVSAIPLAAAHLARLRGTKFRVQIGPLLDIDVAMPPGEWTDASIYSWDASALVGSDANMDAFARGEVTMGFISGAQIDRWGNINVTQVAAPDGLRRLGGALAVAEHCAFARMPVILADLSTRTFVEDVDYVSGFGHRRGDVRREALQLPGPGPTLVITDLAAFDFAANGMRLTTLFGDAQVDDVFDRMAFRPSVVDDPERFVADAQTHALLAAYPLPGIGA
jgi:glutaconate CoA-transferase subunit B